MEYSEQNVDCESTVQNTLTSVDVVDTDESFVLYFDNLLTKSEELSKELKTLNNDIKLLKKKHVKLMKSTNKRKKRRSTDSLLTTNGVKKEPSGFATPIEISNELADFLGLERGSMISRTMVTKSLISYIKDNNLRSTVNGRNFDFTDNTNPKAVAVKQLFNVEKGDEVGYFNLQSYLKRHFISKSQHVKSVQVKEESVELEEEVNTLTEESVNNNNVQDDVKSKKKFRIRKNEK